MEMVRVLKVVEYTGPREWVEQTVAKSLPKETHFGNLQTIRTAVLGIYPEILEEKENKNA